MLVTMGAKRSAQYGDVDGTTGYERKVEVSTDDNTVTELDNSRDAMRLVEDVTRMLRMSHVFFWAIHPMGSDTLGVVPSYDGTDDFDVSRLGPMLVSDEGLKSLVKYGQLTEPEMKALVATGLPPSQYPYVLLEWAGIRCVDGMQDGTLRATPGIENEESDGSVRCDDEAVEDTDGEDENEDDGDNSSVESENIVYEDELTRMRTTGMLVV